MIAAVAIGAVVLLYLATRRGEGSGGTLSELGEGLREGAPGRAPRPPIQNCGPFQRLFTPRRCREGDAISNANPSTTGGRSERGKIIPAPPGGVLRECGPLARFLHPRRCGPNGVARRGPLILRDGDY